MIPCPSVSTSSGSRVKVWMRALILCHTSEPLCLCCLVNSSPSILPSPPSSLSRWGELTCHHVHHTSLDALGRGLHCLSQHLASVPWWRSSHSLCCHCPAWLSPAITDLTALTRILSFFYFNKIIYFKNSKCIKQNKWKINRPSILVSQWLSSTPQRQPGSHCYQ